MACSPFSPEELFWSQAVRSRRPATPPTRRVPSQPAESARQQDISFFKERFSRSIRTPAAPAVGSGNQPRASGQRQIVADSTSFNMEVSTGRPIPAHIPLRARYFGRGTRTAAQQARSAIPPATGTPSPAAPNPHSNTAPLPTSVARRTSSLSAAGDGAATRCAKLTRALPIGDPGAAGDCGVGVAARIRLPWHPRHSEGLGELVIGHWARPCRVVGPCGSRRTAG